MPEALQLGALWVTLTLLALLPSTSVAVVISQASQHGLAAAMATTVGIAVADVLFVVVALGGWWTGAKLAGALDHPLLSLLAQLLAAALLLTYAWQLFRSSPSTSPSTPVESGRTVTGGFALGFLLTLVDAKAVLFYVALLPTIVNAEQLGAWGIASIATCAAAAIVVAKGSYAVATVRGRGLLPPRIQRAVPKLMALLLLLSACVLLFNAARLTL